jgi:outer membrane protein OmpA-like peptidoglycan-associated protein
MVVTLSSRQEKSMSIINLSLFTNRIITAFVIQLVMTACTQHKISGTSVAADNNQLKPSNQIEQNDNLRLAQNQTGNCQKRSAENAKILDLGDQAAKTSDIVGFFSSSDCPEPLTRQIKKKTDLTSTTKKLSMQINFELNSARLTPAGRRALQPVGEALAANELRNKRFIIEGHTDAKGKASYNLTLSKRRAQAVKQYLVNNFAMDPSHLVAVGKGSSELLNSAAPDAPENRRVVIALPQ